MGKKDCNGKYYNGGLCTKEGDCDYQWVNVIQGIKWCTLMYIKCCPAPKEERK